MPLARWRHLQVVKGDSQPSYVSFPLFLSIAVTLYLLHVGRASHDLSRQYGTFSCRALTGSCANRTPRQMGWAHFPDLPGLVNKLFQPINYPRVARSGYNVTCNSTTVAWYAILFSRSGNSLTIHYELYTVYNLIMNVTFEVTRMTNKNLIVEPRLPHKSVFLEINHIQISFPLRIPHHQDMIGNIPNDQ